MCTELKWETEDAYASTDALVRLLTMVSKASCCASPHENGVPCLDFCFLGTWDGLRYFIVALPEPSI